MPVRHPRHPEIGKFRVEWNVIAQFAKRRISIGEHRFRREVKIPKATDYIAVP